jgi:hypothetical protein
MVISEKEEELKGKNRTIKDVICNKLVISLLP